jgi:hypothetical protein
MAVRHRWPPVALGLWALAAALLAGWMAPPGDRQSRRGALTPTGPAVRGSGRLSG